MKYLFLIALALFMGCQDAKETGPSVEKVAQIEDEAFDKQNFVLTPTFNSIEILGSNIKKEGDKTLGEDITIREKSSSKTIDEFSMLDWGTVNFKSDSESFKIYPEEALEITYTLKDGKINRTTECKFLTPVDQLKFNEIMTEARGIGPDWEEVYYSLSRLAVLGHKDSYEFFMNPNDEAKKFLKNSEGSVTVESIYRVLNFMKKNGCKW